MKNNATNFEQLSTPHRETYPQSHQTGYQPPSTTNQHTPPQYSPSKSPPYLAKLALILPPARTDSHIQSSNTSTKRIHLYSQPSLVQPLNMG